MADQEITHKSPPWGANVKLIVGLSFVAILAGFFFRFQNIISPLLLTFILTYLLHPLISKLNQSTKLSWRMSVHIIFLLLIILLLGSFTLTGVALVTQLESLVNVVENSVETLPDTVMSVLSTVIQIGPYQIELSDYFSVTNLEGLIQQAIGIIQPVLGQAGGLIGTLASGTAATLMWGFFVILISYFVLADMGEVPNKWVDIELSGYDDDIRRIGRELSRVWNAFLRGQIILFTMTVIVYSIALTLLGLRYSLALAILAGLARFVPYIGPWVTWIVIGLVTIFQGQTYGLEAWQYTLWVIVIAIVIDQVFDNVISPRIMGRSLGVHPAGVLLAAIIAANLIGLVGVVLAAPVLASFTLLGRYVSRKMLDLDPWPDQETESAIVEFPWKNLWTRFQKWIITTFERRQGK